ncbi:S8/S53 family peptidase [Georgenia sp. M64]|uniref:S8/S53 family peptidase n=1 Tax=Georgenia sp. M64 TaxID=3120520 RepID=UPI0030E3BB3D
MSQTDDQQRPPTDRGRPPGAARAGVPLPTPARVARHGGRVLDPLTASRLPGEPAPLPTAYRADRLVVAGEHADEARAAIADAARRLSLAAVEDTRGRSLAARRGGRAPRTLTLEPAAVRELTTRVVAAPDAWEVLQLARSAVRPEVRAAMGLDHILMGTGPDIGGAPFTSGHGVEGAPFTSGHGVEEYGRAGSGGRQPVSWLGAPPVRRPAADLPGRRPVVAVVDTGCGEHPWLADVERDLALPDGTAAGLPGPTPEESGDVVGPLDGELDSHAGHGTFICGILRQLCPDADLVAVPVMAGDGVVLESDLLHALAVITELVELDRAGATGGVPVDVVVLSLGYHHEVPEDATFDTPLLEALRGLGRLGVAVVAAAGNGATTDPLYPAAFAPHDGGPVQPDGCVPVTSVAATNPDGSVALFANAGAWVSCWHPGAALVSTMPVTFQGGRQPRVSYAGPGGHRRATLDPDDFGSGFAVWSGTSFAAPVMAGLLAARLLDGTSTGAAGEDATGEEGASGAGATDEAGSTPVSLLAAAGTPGDPVARMAALVGELVAAYATPGRKAEVGS